MENQTESQAGVAKPSESKGQALLLQSEWWKEASVWIIAPFVGYYLAFKYEQGYCSEFGLNDIFIRVELTTVLSFTGLFVGFAFMFLTFMHFLFFAEGATQTWAKILGRYAPLIVFLFVYVLVSMEPIDILRLTGLLALLVVLDILNACKKGDKSLPIAKRILSQPLLIMTEEQPFGFLRKRMGVVAMSLFLILWGGGILAARVGHTFAASTVKFLVPISEPNAVVVRRYNDSLICAYIDPQTKAVMNRYVILPTNLEKGVQLELKNLGTLKIPE